MSKQFSFSSSLQQPFSFSSSLHSLTFNVTTGASPNQLTYTQPIESVSLGNNTVPISDPYIITAFKSNPQGTIFNPSIVAEFGKDDLGNPISTVVTRSEQEFVACNCTGTPEQASLTTAVAMVFNCMDFRLRDNTNCNLNCKGYYNNYDEVIAAGVSLGYNGLSVPPPMQANYSSSTFIGWSDYIDTHITLGHLLHSINEILIVEHCQCGAYASHYGDRTISVPTTIQGVTKYPMSGNYLVQQHERDLQAQNVQTCGTALWNKFNGTNGTVRPINNLVIIGYIAAIDGSHLTEIYRRNS
jgi:hypothetical protein